jgi:hypothetical protein
MVAHGLARFGIEPQAVWCREGVLGAYAG